MLRRPWLVKGIVFCDRFITISAFLCYPMVLLWIARTHPQELKKSVLIPMIGFCCVSAVRYFFPAQRPYEKYQIQPLIPKDTIRKSFPSRHVFSIIMLAETYLYTTTDSFAGIFYLAGLCLAVCRVLLGVHFVRDVFVGGMVALFFGLLYYLL